MKQQNIPHLISIADVTEFHQMVIKLFGGRDGIHNKGLLESAINQPLRVIEYGKKSDQALYNLAAVYFYHLIKNHPFIDGNKRTALFTALHFLGQNGFGFDAKLNDLYELALKTAESHREEEKDQIKKVASFFRDAIRPLNYFSKKVLK
jgi:death-on-curing protein